MPTRLGAEFAAGLVRFELDYDISNRLTTLRCINQTAQPAYGLVARAGGTPSYGGTCPANQTTTFTVPITTAGRILLALNLLGMRLGGMEGTFRWPA
jgi:hypothetical protein